MDIFHIIQTMKVGGAQRSLINIIKSTKENRHSIFSAHNEYVEELNMLNVDFYDIQNIDIFRLIYRFKPDIIHLHWWPESTLYDLKKYRKLLGYNYRIVITIQDPEPLSLDLGDYYIFCSEYVRQQQKEFAIKKGEVILDLIDNKKFLKLKKIQTHNEIHIVRHSMIYPNKINTTILKNIDSCINQLQSISHSKIIFTICGDGSKYRNYLIQYVKKKFCDANYFF